MEVISIEAATFEEMKQALSSIIRDIRTGRGIRQEERLTEWMDNQEACIMMDISCLLYAAREKSRTAG